MKVANQVILYFVVVVLLVLAGMGIMLNRVYAINIAHQRLIQEGKELQLSINLLIEIDNLAELMESLPQEGMVNKSYMTQVSKLVSVLDEIRNNSTKVEEFEEASHVLTEEAEFLDIHQEFDQFRQTAASLRLGRHDSTTDVKSKMLSELGELRMSGRKLQAIYMDSMTDASAYAERARRQALFRTILVFVTVLFLLGLAAGWFIYLINKNTKAMLEREKGLTIGLLAQSLAHEIRNPLGIIKSSTSVIKRKLSPNSEEYEIAGYLTEEVDRINELIEQLLHFRQEPKIDKKLQDPFPVLEQVKRLLTGVCDKADVQIELINRAHGQQVLFDAAQIKQALINVVLNAVQASRSGGRVIITAEAESKTYSIIVRDYGSGFKRNALKKAYDPFYTTKENGLGLGLFMVKKIVESHEGTITIHPNPDEGTSVTIGLKLNG